MTEYGLRPSHKAKTTLLAGYLHEGGVWCKACVLNKFCWNGYRWTAETALDGEARRRGLDRDDEASFSDVVFPKPLFREDLKGGEVCWCGDPVT